MKNIIKYISLSVLCLSLFSGVSAQQGLSPLEDVAESIRTNNIGEITKYFDNIVPITINNTQSIYSRTQAEMVLRDFFSKNPPKDFTVMDNGSSGSNSKFAIGDLNTSNGKYNVYILLKTKENGFVLQEIRFNKE